MVGHVILGFLPQGLVVTCVGLASLQVEDITMAAVPVVVIAAVLQGVGVEAVGFLVVAPGSVRALQEAFLLVE